MENRFRDMDAQFTTDAAALRSAIRDLKVRAGETEPIAQTTSEPVVTQVIHDASGKLANRAKDLRGLTEKRFAEVIDGWRRQNESLKQELEMYQNQQRVGQERSVLNFIIMLENSFLECKNETRR